MPAFDVAVPFLDRQRGGRDKDQHDDQADAELHEEIEAEFGLGHYDGRRVCNGRQRSSDPVTQDLSP